MTRLLIIDDDTFFVNLASYFFKNEGYIIDATQDGKIAIDLSNKNKYDLVLCGTQLQHKSGFEVASTIRHYSPETQIILISPANNIVSMNVTDELVYDAYFQKPINFNQLLETMARLLSSEKV